MGLIGILITIGMIVFGSWYYFFPSSSNKEIVLTNEGTLSEEVSTVSQYEGIKQQAESVKNLVEENAKKTLQMAEEESVPLQQPKEKVTEEKTSLQDIKIIDRLMTGGFSVPKNERVIDTIVLHSSYDLNGTDLYSVEGIVKEYEDYGVSAHYLVDRKGVVYRLVEDKNIAYHAGVSKMPDNRKNVNDFSLGIEMMNTEEGQFTNAQYDTVKKLITMLKKKYPIKSVVGHNDIAPERKTDPWNFNWKKLQ